MSKNRRIFTIILSSPSDVMEERSSVRECVETLNATLFHHQDIGLEIIGWETDSYPEFGDSPQDIIDHQFGEEYDIFIGILWSRFGSPTDKYESGTEQEFYNAINKFSKFHGSRLPIMIYFKTSGLPYNVDLDQLKKIREFRERIMNQGLYAEYSSGDNLKNLIMLHLPKIVNYLRTTKNEKTNGKNDEKINNRQTNSLMGDYETEKNEKFDELSEDNAGLLDSLIEFESFMNKAIDNMNESSEFTKNLRMEITIASEDLSRVNLTGGSSNDRKEILDNVAILQDNYANHILSFNEKLRKNLIVGLRHFGFALAIYKEDFQVDTDIESKSHYDSARKSAAITRQEISQMIETLASMRIIISNIPRLTRKFRQSRRRLLDALEQTESVLRDAVGMIDEATR